MTRRGVDRAAELLDGLDCVVPPRRSTASGRRSGRCRWRRGTTRCRTNLSGTFYVCRAALPHLVAAGGGSIVTLTSVAAYRVWPHDAAYSASKAGSTCSRARSPSSTATQGVRANCISPGVIDAGMTDLIEDENERERLARMHALPRLGLAEEVAEAAVWLASDASSFTSGSVLRVDGGFLDYSSSGG